MLLRPHRFTPREWSLLADLTLFLWPLFFLATALYYFGHVPIFWQWDTFSYLEAARSRTPYVPLGLGRTPFVLVGGAMAYIARKVAEPDLFATFRVWVTATVLLQTCLLVPFALALRRHVGLVGAHAALAVFCSNVEQMNLFLNVWPETWSWMFGLSAALVLLSPRGSYMLRLAVATVLALGMVLMKEVSIYYLPALAWLVLLAPGAPPALLQRLMAAGLLGAIAGGLGLGIPVALPSLLPGLREARATLLREHFALTQVGLVYFVPNLRALAGHLFANPAVAVLSAAGLLRLIVGGFLRRRVFVRKRLALVLLLLVPPALFIAATGHAGIMSRYSMVLVPGVALAAGMLLLPPGPRLLARPWVRCGLAVALVGAVLVWNNFKLLQDFSIAARKDFGRYEAMATLTQTPLGVMVAEDSWPAHFIHTHRGPDHRAVWEIQWPGWNFTDQEPLPTEFLQRQAAARRALAIAPSTAAKVGLTFEELRQRLSHWRLQEHPSGWWVGAYVGP